MHIFNCDREVRRKFIKSKDDFYGVRLDDWCSQVISFRELYLL